MKEVGGRTLGVTGGPTAEREEDKDKLLLLSTSDKSADPTSQALAAGGNQKQLAVLPPIMLVKVAVG